MNAPGAIAIVGTGRLARALARILAEAGQPLVAIAGRNTAHAAEAASFAGPEVRAIAINGVPAVAERVLIAVSDDAIPAVAATLADGGTSGIALHTSGARGPAAIAPLQERGIRCGVLHPLQTIATPERGVEALRGATFGIGGDPEAVGWGEEIVALAGGTPLRVSSDGFASYHAGAVMAGNAVIAALDVAAALLEAAGIERRAALQALGPLCLASARNAVDLGPEAALTGPVQRGDAATIRLHAAALRNTPAHVVALYRAASNALIEIARQQGLDPAAAAAIEDALAPLDPGPKN